MLVHKDTVKSICPEQELCCCIDYSHKISLPLLLSMLVRPHSNLIVGSMSSLNSSPPVFHVTYECSYQMFPRGKISNISAIYLHNFDRV